jgi:hypothetical protein
VISMTFNIGLHWKQIVNIKESDERQYIMGRKV